MTMLTAAEVLERHPQGCWVFDAHGRRLKHVFACDPDTGEVVLWCQAWSPLAWLVGLLPRPRPTWWWIYPSEVPRRHGFWPAPLRVVPKLSRNEIKDRIASGSGGTKALSISDLDELVDAMEGNGRRQSLAKLADTSSTLPATAEEHEQLCDAIAARRQAGGPIPPGQPYIVGNGDREQLQ